MTGAGVFVSEAPRNSCRLTTRRQPFGFSRRFRSALVCFSGRVNRQTIRPTDGTETDAFPPRFGAVSTRFVTVYYRPRSTLAFIKVNCKAIRFTKRSPLLHAPLHLMCFIGPAYTHTHSIVRPSTLNLGMSARLSGTCVFFSVVASFPYSNSFIDENPIGRGNG